MTMPFKGRVLTYEEHLKKQRDHASDPDAHGQRIETLTLLAPVVAGINWTMPAAEAEFPGNTRFRTKVDLTDLTQARITARVITAGAAGSKLRLHYSTDQTAWATLGTAGPEIPVSTANTTAVSDWVDLVQAAQTDVFLRAVGLDADGTTAINFGLITAQFR